ncbi:zinc ABC transporter substrate-binding protein [Gymnodinialimonas ulvae]|uniref:zinc ABC transporter substrate-binding protein n=1 Tax=Gymnodinialimonas ulvae TaxID=3126504 RepID=UPI003095CCCB
MSRMRVSLSIMASLMGGTAMAEVPNVAVDIAPVHSLVTRVMAGVGEPALVIPAGASPHEYNLRPSEAAALQDADLVFWMGEDLTPWLEDAVETLAEGAAVTELLSVDGIRLLDFREGALFEAHSHGDHGDHDDHEEHADHDEHDHEEHADHDEHDHDDHGHDDHAGHDHGEHDPHAWLAPSNATVWLNVIAAELSAVDPENAGTYFANAAEAIAEMEALSAQVRETLARVQDMSFIVFHDAYQYFEADFGLSAAGAISIGDATDPSPARIAEIQGRLRDEGVDCVLSEPQFNPGLVEAALDGTEAATAVIDPLGAELEPGPDLYPTLIRNMAATLASCG